MNKSAHTTPKTSTERDPRWAAVLARDPSANDRFVYAVRTTGVYCRPGSPSRLPRPENVEFFDTPAAAEAAGYRPSRRADADQAATRHRSEEHTSELQSLMRNSYAVFCLKKNKITPTQRAICH